MAETDIFEILSSPEFIEGPCLNLGCRQIVEFWLIFWIFWKFWKMLEHPGKYAGYILKRVLFNSRLNHFWEVVKASFDIWSRSYFYLISLSMMCLWGMHLPPIKRFDRRSLGGSRMWQQRTGRTGKIAPTQIQIDPLDGYEVIRSSTRTQKKVQQEGTKYQIWRWETKHLGKHLCFNLFV